MSEPVYAITLNEAVKQMEEQGLVLERVIPGCISFKKESIEKEVQ